MVVRGDWVTGEAWVGPASLKGRFQALALQLWGERNFTLEEWPVSVSPSSLPELLAAWLGSPE